MTTLKLKTSPTAESTDNGRRSFITKLGVGVSAVLGSTAVVARDETGDAAALSLRVALLEDEKALRKLHQAFEDANDKGLYDEVIGMFSDDAEVVFNGGLFAHRSQGISRLYRNHFRFGKTGKRMEPAPGFELDLEQQQDSVDVAPDRLSAKAIFPYSIRVGRLIEADTSLASMARLHGEGVQTWWEGGAYRVAYARDVATGRWKIHKLEYNTLARADYRPGRSYARPMSASPFSTRFPEDQQGPDALL